MRRNDKVSLRGAFTLLIGILSASIATQAKANDVPAGSDMFITPPGCCAPGCGTFVDLGDPDATPIPADFFGPGSDPFLGVICLKGAPLVCTVGDSRCKGADTIVERLSDAQLPFVGSSDTVDIQIRALHLISDNPITVTFNGDLLQFSEYDVEVFLSEHCEQRIGTMTINLDSPTGGTFTSRLSVTVKLVFTKVGPGPGVQTATLDPPGECMGGSNDGVPCLTDAVCTGGGICACFRTTDELFTGPTPQNPFAPPGHWFNAVPPAPPTYYSVPAGDADHDGDGVIVETGSSFPATTSNFYAGLSCSDPTSLECYKVATPEEADWAEHGIMPLNDNNAPPAQMKCIYHITCREGSDCSACPAADTNCQTIDCATDNDCPLRPAQKCGGPDCCAAYKFVKCRVPDVAEPVCPNGANCDCPQACATPPATAPDDVRDYACKCYDRLGITPDQFVNEVGWTINCKQAGQGTMERLDTTVNGRVQSKDCTGIANCDVVTDFPKECKAGTNTGLACDSDADCPSGGIGSCEEACDRPAWLQFAPHRCYGHTYIHKWEITASTPRPGKSNVTVALLCRHKKIWSDGGTDFNDIAMIMHNSDNGETCWFQSPDSAPNDMLDGRTVPAPHAEDAPYNATTKRGWQTPSDTAGINCIHCHDNGPWMNSRWMFHSDIDLRDGLGPYINDGFAFKDWSASTGGRPKFVTVGAFGLTPEQGHTFEEKSCTSCHKIHSGETDKVHNPDRTKGAGGKSLVEWIKFTVGQDYPPKSNATGQDFPIAYWMPPRPSNFHDVYAADAADWGNHYDKHVAQLLACAQNKGEKAKDIHGNPVKTDPCDEMKPQVGGCCVVATGVCANDITRSECDRTNDKYLGDGVKCSPTNCPLPSWGGAVASAAVTLIPGVHLEADTNNAGTWAYHSSALSEGSDCTPTADPPCTYTVSESTLLKVRWSADADHLNCFITSTFPAGVAVNSELDGTGIWTGTGSNWLLGESPQTIGVLTVPGEYYFIINCDDDDYDKIRAPLTFRIEGQPPTVLHVQGIVDGVGTMAFDYPSPAGPHVDIPVAPASEVIIAWTASNVVAGTCALSETFDPPGPTPRTFPEESGFESVTLYPMTNQNYTLTCTGEDAQEHSVGVTLRVVIAPIPVWDSGTLSPDRATRTLRFSVESPVVATGSPVQSAIKVSMIDLQNPVPPNLPQFQPPDFSAYESGLSCTDPAGCARWVGRPGTFYESQGPPLTGPYRAARLQCTPFYWDWITETATDPIVVVGAEIVPSSEYSVQTYASSCKGVETGCANVSAAVTMYTRRSGDVDTEYNPPSATNQPNAIDVAQSVNKFKNAAGAPDHYRAQLQANLPELNASVNALDIVAVVDAVKGFAYAFSGPCPCPSTVTCGATCTGCPGMCVKTCIGGNNAGEPCINDNHCPSGACSAVGTCRDQCGRCTP